MKKEKKPVGKHRHSRKDRPRYRAIKSYEQEFKTVYAKMLGDGMAEVTAEMNQMVRSGRHDLHTG